MVNFSADSARFPVLLYIGVHEFVERYALLGARVVEAAYRRTVHDAELDQERSVCKALIMVIQVSLRRRRLCCYNRCCYLVVVETMVKSYIHVPRVLPLVRLLCPGQAEAWLIDCSGRVPRDLPGAGHADGPHQGAEVRSVRGVGSKHLVARLRNLRVICAGVLRREESRHRGFTENVNKPTDGRG